MWDILKAQLDEDDVFETWKPELFEFPSRPYFRNPFERRNSIQDLASALATDVERVSNDCIELAFVCHSMGGLVARQTIVDLLASNIDLPPIRLLCCATPNQGTRTASLFKRVFPRSRYLAELSPRNKVIAELNLKWAMSGAEDRILARYLRAQKDAVVIEGAEDPLSKGNGAVWDHPAETHKSIVRPSNKDSKLYKDYLRFFMDLKSVDPTSTVQFEQLLKHEMANVTKRYVRAYGPTVHSTRYNKEVDFSANQILESLMDTAIPIANCVEIVAALPLKLTEMYPVSSHRELSTRQLRAGVWNTIWSLGNKYSHKKIKKWAMTYAWQYGDPDRRLSFIPADGGGPIELSYSVAKSHLITKVFENVLRTPLDTLGEIVSESDLNHMAQYVMTLIKRFYRYYIDEDALVAMLTEFATQPPHPWLPSPFNHKRNLAYDRERVNKWSERLANINVSDKGQSDAFAHAVGELVHHSCSFILLYFGCYVGPRHLSSLRSLNKMVKIVQAEDFVRPWESCNIEQLRHLDVDLLALEQSLDWLESKTSNLFRMKEHGKRDWIAHLAPLTSCYRLVESEYRVSLRSNTRRNYVQDA